MLEHRHLQTFRAGAAGKLPAETMTSTPPTSPDAGWLVICLCADWCGTCRSWRSELAAEAALHPGVQFAWVDIEDQADAVGDVDIETFPTLLIAHGDRPRFLGPVLPHAGAIGRLLESLRADERNIAVTPEAGPLLQRLRAGELEPV